MRRFGHILGAVSIVAFGSCAFLPALGEEDLEEELEISVVDESRGFNPSEAVDDDDEAGVASALGLARDSSIDKDAFEEPDGENPSEGASADVGKDVHKAPDSTDRPGEDLEELPDGESVATTEEVADLVQEREAEVAEARGREDDRAAKVDVASNPSIAPQAPAESPSSEFLDVIMETVLIGVMSLLLAALATLFHRLPRGVRIALVVATLGLGGWVGFSLG